MNLPEPTQTAFTEAEEALSNLMQGYDADIDTKKGSVVRELLIRPYAYLYAKATQFLSDWIKRTSVQELSQSDDISDSIADLVASNYFVTRKQGSYATGIVTITCDSSEVRVNASTGFMIDGAPFTTDKTCIATLNPLEDTQELTYIQLIQIGDTYKANIPIRASQTGPLEIPSGAQVQIASYIAGAISAELLSPVTGGSGTETNAEMMRRCKDRCGAAIGTLQAVRTKMQDAPVPVLSCGAVASGQPGCFSSRYNNMAIPMGGVADVYVKTSNQSLVKELLIPAQDFVQDTERYIQITPDKYPELAGSIRIASVRAAAQGIPTLRYTVQYISTDEELSDIAARCTAYQKVKISFPQLSAAVPILLTVQYMSGILQLQDFMNNAYGAYLGQQCRIKAAVPAQLALQCQLYTKEPLEDTFLQELKEFIAAQVNSMHVGNYNLNMDEIAERVQAKYQNIKLRVPYTISVSLPATDDSVYTFNTTDGTVSLLYRRSAYHWAAQAYFFSLIPSNISLQVIS